MQNPPPDSGSADAARVQISNQVHFWLDEPVDWNRKVRWLRLSGWCVAKRDGPLTAIRAQLRGQTFPGYFDRDRPEVAAHVGMPDAPRWCGFTVDVRVPFGRGRLELQVARGDGSWQKAYACDVWGPLLLGTRERGIRRQIALADAQTRDSFSVFGPKMGAFEFWFHPPPDEWPRKVRYLRLEGWCFATDGTEITDVRARVGEKNFRAHYGILRPDVALAYDRRAGSLRSGFSLDVIVPWGRWPLALAARSRHGEWREFFARSIRGPIAWRARDDVSSPIGNYPAWIRRYDTLTRTDRFRIRRRIAQMQRRPLISILLPAYNSELTFLRRTIHSVRAQLYPHWELCAVDDASTGDEVWNLLQQSAHRDSRIKILRRACNGHICAASNDALRMASGEFIALLDHDDELAAAALFFVAHEVNQDPRLQLLYSDEDKLDPRGRRYDPHFKPDWNPDLFTAQNYVSHLSVYATELARRAGGFRVGFEGAQDFDLTLRCIDQIGAREIRHIPHVLYHWRSITGSTAGGAEAKPYAQDAACRAVQEHFERTGVAAQVEPVAGGYLRARHPLPAERPRVSLIIPTRDRADILRTCVGSILSRTDYPNFEILLLDNESREPAALDYLASVSKNERVVVHRCAGSFNYSQLNNFGVAEASGSFIGLMNNDLEVMNSAWLSEMIRHGARPEIGAVGARLWYPNGTIQHGGVILGAGGIGSHAHAGLARGDHGYFSRPHLTQNLSAVTAACLLVRKDLYLEMGGLDATNLPVGFNDVDFCLRLQAAGYRILWTPEADLCHHESASRGFEDTREKRERFLAEVDYMRQKWGAQLKSDPAYNPNLSLSDQLFTLAFPPRTEKPWTKP